MHTLGRRRRTGNGLSAAELIESAKNSFVRTKELRNQKIDINSPRLFRPVASDEEEDEDDSSPQNAQFYQAPNIEGEPRGESRADANTRIDAGSEAVDGSNGKTSPSNSLYCHNCCYHRDKRNTNGTESMADADSRKKVLTTLPTTQEHSPISSLTPHSIPAPTNVEIPANSAHAGSADTEPSMLVVPPRPPKKPRRCPVVGDLVVIPTTNAPNMDGVQEIRAVPPGAGHVKPIPAPRRSLHGISHGPTFPMTHSIHCPASLSAAVGMSQSLYAPNSFEEGPAVGGDSRKNNNDGIRVDFAQLLHSINQLRLAAANTTPETPATSGDDRTTLANCSNEETSGESAFSPDSWSLSHGKTLSTGCKTPTEKLRSITTFPAELQVGFVGREWASPRSIRPSVYHHQHPISASMHATLQTGYDVMHPSSNHYYYPTQMMYVGKGAHLDPQPHPACYPGHAMAGTMKRPAQMSDSCIGHFATPSMEFGERVRRWERRASSVEAVARAAVRQRNHKEQLAARPIKTGIHWADATPPTLRNPHTSNLNGKRLLSHGEANKVSRVERYARVLQWFYSTTNPATTQSNTS